MPTEYAFFDDSGNERLRGTLVPDPGVASASLEKLGPFPVTYQTANIDNPGDGIGALVGPMLPAGTLVLAAWLQTTTPWAATVSIDGLVILLATATATLIDLQSSVATKINGAAYQLSVTSGGNSVAPLPPVIQSGTDQLAVSFYTTANLTAGAGDVYAVIASA